MLLGLNSRLRKGHVGHTIIHGLTTRPVVGFRPMSTIAAVAKERRYRAILTSFIPKRTSQELRELLGQNREVMSEQEAKFLILQYCRQHDQADPTDKNYSFGDEQLGAILGQRRFHRQKLHETLLFSHLEPMDDDEHKTAWAIPRVAKLLGKEPASGEEAVRELYAYAEGRGLQDRKQKCYVLSDEAMKAAGFGTKVDMHQWVRITPELFEE